MPPHRRKAAVTVAGVLLLLPAVGLAYWEAAYFAARIDISFDPRIVAVEWAFAVVLALAGLAIVRRWRGWRIWAGTIAWGLIAIVVLNLFNTPPPGPVRSFKLAFMLGALAIAMFVLIAKRRERKLDLRAVFD
jgi:peptidoglycan/LPS O-acetylase OafA/YrhL